MQSWSQATLISSSSRWARTKKTKKIRSPQTPYWEAPAKHIIPHFILIGGVWSVICWFGIGVVSKCLSSFGRYIPSPTYCGARDETSCLMCTVWAAGDAGFSTAPSAQKPKKNKKKQRLSAKSSSITHYYLHHLCWGDHKNNTDRWPASISQLVLFNTPAALHQSIYMYLLGNLFER